METSKAHSGFTLIELLVVIVILAIAAAMAVPMFSGAAEVQLQSAANMIAADLEYAKSMAIRCQQNYGVAFHINTQSYDVVKYNDVTHQDEVQLHPVKKGFPYTVNFGPGSQLNQAKLLAATPDTIYFNFRGRPLDSNFNKIILQGGESKIYVYVVPATGYIRISDLDE